MEFFDVYITDDISAVGKIYPPLRRQIIDGTKDMKLKRQRCAVWLLLKTAVKNSLGLEFEKLDFYLSENGKWSTDNFFFSLSHTEGLVAVVLSSKPVGIDVESVLRFSKEKDEKLLKRIAAEGEENIEVCRLWTQKESIFKCGRGAVFKPKEIKTEDYPVNTLYIGSHTLSVCGEGKDKANYYFIKNDKILKCNIKGGKILL